MTDKLKYGYQLPGANDGEIAALEARLQVSLPDDYRAFLRASNGFNDDVGKGYLVLWRLDELAGGADYGIFEPGAGHVLIGSNGGPTAYGIVDDNYVAIPFVAAGPWRDELRHLGGSFEEFVAAIEEGEGW